MDWKKIFYRICRFLAILTLGLVWPFRAKGRKNIPEGAVIVCANHSHWIDPVLMCFALPGKHHVCLMAKQELFKNRLAAWFFRAIGTFPVNRLTADMEAMKTAIYRLKDGKKLGIFPEGTRSSEDNAVSPKAGAIRLAEKTGAPLLPVYIPRQKRRFHRTPVVIGEPFRIEKAPVRRSREDYEALADELMSRIERLGAPSTVGGVNA